MKTIVVGLDGSPRAPAVLDAAVALARGMGARLDVIRAVTIPVELPIEAMTVAPDGLPALLLERAQANLRAQAERAPRELLNLVESRIGTPWQVICDHAKECGADLIVVGTHGHSALDRLLGTTAARVVNHAPCSVYVVRNAALTPGGGV